MGWNIFLAASNPWRVIQFYWRIRNMPNLACPASLHEKYLWRKIVDRNPKFVEFSDKLLAKQFVLTRYPSLKCARVLWQGTDIFLAPKELLSRPGYLKSNSGSGQYLRLGGGQSGAAKLHRLTRRWLRRKWHRHHGEWAYKHVNPTLFIEEEVTAQQGLDSLLDLTIYAFGGTISHIAAMADHKSSETRFARFDANLKRMPLGEYPTAGMERRARGRNAGSPRVLPDEVVLPAETRNILGICSNIAAQFDHLRIDVLWNGREFYFTEITVYSRGGFVLYSDQALLERMACLWDLRKSWAMTAPQSGWRKHYTTWLKGVLAGN